MRRRQKIIESFPKLKYFATHCHTLLIFQTTNSVSLNRVSLKYKKNYTFLLLENYQTLPSGSSETKGKANSVLLSIQCTLQFVDWVQFKFYFYLIAGDLDQCTTSFLSYRMKNTVRTKKTVEKKYYVKLRIWWIWCFYKAKSFTSKAWKSISKTGLLRERVQRRHEPRKIYLHASRFVEWPSGPAKPSPYPSLLLRASAILSPRPAFCSPHAIFIFVYLLRLNQLKIKIHFFIVDSAIV